jgi:hypothetical protein
MAVNNNKRILKMIEKRLDLGAKKYKSDVPLEDGRDFIRETLEELLDACVYLSGELLKLSDKVDRYKPNLYGKDY